MLKVLAGGMMRSEESNANKVYTVIFPIGAEVKGRTKEEVLEYIDDALNCSGFENLSVIEEKEED